MRAAVLKGHPETKDIEQAPALEIDKLLYKDKGGRPHARGVLERRIIWNLFRHLEAAGYKVASVYDGEEDTETADARAAMELIFNLDDAWVYFHRPADQIAAERANAIRIAKEEGTEPPEDLDAPRYEWIRLVLGNEFDIISDYGVKAGATFGRNGDEGPFGNAVKAFDPEVCA